MKPNALVLFAVAFTAALGSGLYLTRIQKESDREFRRVVGIPLPDNANVQTIRAKEAGFNVELVQQITNLPVDFTSQVCTLLPSRQGASPIQLAYGTRSQRGSQCSFRILHRGVVAEVLVHENSILLTSG